MESINDLLKELDNKVPASIAKRLEGLRKLNEKLEVARAENNENPTEESKEQLDEIVEFIKDTQDDLRDDLKELVYKKTEAEELKKRQIAQRKAELEANERAEELKKRKIAQRKAELEENERAEELKKRQIDKRRAEYEQKQLAEKKANEEREELEKKALLEKDGLNTDTDTDVNKDTEKKSGIGWGGMVLGGVLLVLSAGAINYFGKKR